MAARGLMQLGLSSEVAHPLPLLNAIDLVVTAACVYYSYKRTGRYAFLSPLVAKIMCWAVFIAVKFEKKKSVSSFNKKILTSTLMDWHVGEFLGTFLGSKFCKAFFFPFVNILQLLYFIQFKFYTRWIKKMCFNDKLLLCILIKVFVVVITSKNMAFLNFE